MRDWMDWIGRSISGNEVRYKNGSTLLFLHGEDLDSIKNINAGGALMVQAEEMNEEDFWFLNGRLRRQDGTRQLRLECNYDGHNWIHKLFNKENIGRLVVTNTFDNEKNLPPDYIPNLKKLPKRLQERHLYGTDADAEGMVFDEYSESRHVVQPYNLPAEYDRLVILDHGIRNPTAVLWCAVDFDGNLIIYDEHYEREKPISYHASKIKDRDNSRVLNWYADPSITARTQSKNGQLWSVADEYRDNGISFTPADNNVLAGINRVNEYFKDNRLKIFKNCVNLIEEIGQYKWKKLRPGQQKNEPDEPVKFNDHACDCLRYCVMSRPEKSDLIRSFTYEQVSEKYNPLEDEDQVSQVLEGIEA